MSYLSLPRVGFFGTECHISVSTANNENVLSILDYDKVELKNPTGKPMTPAEYREWLLGVVDVQYEGGAKSRTLRGYWNYYGDHSAHWGPASVNRVWPLNGDPVTERPSDPLLSAQVQINARIVDLNPADTFTSQFYSSVMQITAPGPDGPVILLSGRNPMPHATRWLNFNRPRGAGSFLFAIPNDQIKWAPPGLSPLLDQLREIATTKGAGISVRYCYYALQNKEQYTAEAMSEAFKRGEFPQHIRTGPIIGSIGVWYGEDLPTAPVGRILYPKRSPYVGGPGPTAAMPKSHGEVEQLWALDQPGRLLTDESDPAAKMAPAVAMVDKHRRMVTLDLISAFPEAGMDGWPDAMTKLDQGPVGLYLQYQGKSYRLGQVAYDYQNYVDANGLVEISYGGAFDPVIHLGDLCLARLDDEADRANRPIDQSRLLLTEMVIPQIEAEERCTYIDLGETTTITLRSFHKGQPSPNPAIVELHLYKEEQTPSYEDGNQNPPLVTPTELAYRPIPAVEVLGVSHVVIPPRDSAKVTVRPRAPGCYKIRFVPQGVPLNPNDPKPDFSTEFFCAFRVLPKDDYDHYSDEQINSWPFIYEQIFNYYAQLYPVMARIIPWGPNENADDIERTRMFAALMLQAIDVKNLGSTMAMPITREMSAGKRKLLQRWCELQLNASGVDR